SETKSRFLANMSHELRTPLNAILGFSEVIRDHTLGKDAQDRYAEYAGHIHQSGRHLLELINDILDLSKIEAGKFELVEAPVDLFEIAGTALHFVEVQASEKGVRLVRDVPAPILAVVDSRAILQILVNLLTNAVKFTLKGGSVTLRIVRTLNAI